MKSLIKYLFFAILTTSCGESGDYFPKTTYDSPFPKRNFNLTNIFGDKLTLKSGTDTLTLTISYFKNYNLITNNKTQDTLFKGTVCKFRGLYYFTQQLNDTCYWIYAVKLTDNLVFGLNTGWEQIMFIEKAVEQGQYKKIVKSHSGIAIRLHPDKRELKNIYSSIIDNITPDTILQIKEVASTRRTDTSKIVAQIHPEDFEFFSKVYPNPTSGFVNIELHQNNKITYLLTDLNGMIVLSGQFSDFKNVIDLSGQADGIYSMTLSSPIDNFSETVKIVKTKQ